MDFPGGLDTWDPSGPSAASPTHTFPNPETQGYPKFGTNFLGWGVVHERRVDEVHTKEAVCTGMEPKPKEVKKRGYAFS